MFDTVKTVVLLAGQNVCDIDSRGTQPRSITAERQGEMLEYKESAEQTIR